MLRASFVAVQNRKSECRVVLITNMKSVEGYCGSDNSQHINFIDINGHVHELYVHPGARLADVSESTIRREIEAGNLVSVRLRGKPLVLRESLEKALEPPRK